MSAWNRTSMNMDDLIEMSELGIGAFIKIMVKSGREIFIETLLSIKADREHPDR